MAEYDDSTMVHEAAVSFWGLFLCKNSESYPVPSSIIVIAGKENKGSGYKAGGEIEDER
jgi:hypothetical protein